MSEPLKDPVGQAILAFAENGIDQEINVYSDICDDDTYSSAYLFRSYEEMPEIEKVALDHCDGKILDLGAGTGVHVKYLSEKGKNASAIDVSPGAVQYMTKIGLNARQLNYASLENEQYDTLLMLMNGIGIVGSLSNLKSALIHLKSLLTENGKILCDSTDIKYLYMEEDGSLWIDLNTEYYGNFQFQLAFDDHKGDWFDWLYVDFETLTQTADSVGLQVEKLHEEGHHYLACIRRK